VGEVHGSSQAKEWRGIRHWGCRYGPATVAALLKVKRMHSTIQHYLQAGRQVCRPDLLTSRVIHHGDLLHMQVSQTFQTHTSTGVRTINAKQHRVGAHFLDRINCRWPGSCFKLSTSMTAAALLPTAWGMHALVWYALQCLLRASLYLPDEITL
jgi:hypothetical protein